MSDVVKIGLCGKLRSGKDSVANRLWLEHGFEFPFAFGDALKRYAHRIFPDVPEEPKPRGLYQFMNVMRDYDPDVWIKHVERRVETALDRRSTSGIVVSDARQPNEVAWLRDNGFVIVKVVADDGVRRKRAEDSGDLFEAGAMGHETERFIDEIEADYTLDNNGSLVELDAKVDELMTEISRGAVK